MDENNEFLNNRTDAAPADIPDDADITVNDDIPEKEPAAEPDTNPYASQAEEYRRQVSEQAAQPDGAPAQENYQQGANPYGRQPDGSVNPYSNRNAYGYYQQPGSYPVYTAPAPQQEPEKKKGKGKTVFIILAVALLVIGAFFCGRILRKNGTGITLPAITTPAGDTAADSETATEDIERTEGNKIAISPTPSATDALTTEKIAEKARKSSVGVLVYSKSSLSSEAAGEGSGILTPLTSSSSDSGKYTYVLTCAHVIDEKNVTVKIQLDDGTMYDAEIVGYDVRTDVGMLRIEATGLDVCEIGKSSDLQVGSAVYAVGNPGGVEFFGSFTDGIVSAIDRPISSDIGYSTNCIQHTAAINPGNSGGALVNVYGQVVGINSQKIASTEYEGMGFAIPIDSAVKIAEDLISYGYVKDRAKLGVTYYSLSASTQYSIIARANNLPAGSLIIHSISADSSLSGTDVKQYDLIVAVDGQDLDTADVLLSKIEKGKVGDKMTLTIARINSDYSVSKFNVEITLVEDRGNVATESNTNENANPFGNYGYNYGFGY